ncbi:MAG TPA: CPBP family intramembrane glutamic endopeptidase [Ohtaekwangia sp.]|nr:CPBP family intramembrane glutamic endopeptidase [Ohtaekwangia sp.]
MKKIWGFLHRHVYADFQWRYYSVVALFLLGCLFFNYYFDYEDSVLDSYEGLLRTLFYFLTYAFGYYVVLFLYSLFSRQQGFWFKKEFWVKSTFALALLSVDSSRPFLRPVISVLMEPELQYWSYKVATNLISQVVVTAPLLIFYRFNDRQQGHGYGLAVRQFDVRPYFYMLLMMVPLLVAASFNPGFIQQYPMYKTSGAHAFLGVPEWITVFLYEIAYGLDFVSVELLFRGFMVIGLMHVLGRSAVIAMATVYCFLHFGKPAGEAVSSIFGGYILGVVSYETKSIWGGVIIHIGIAWLMELTAFLQH